MAGDHGFGHLLETRQYNVFDPAPHDLIGDFDAFYVNPPYGSQNVGESGRLFITRGCELARPFGTGIVMLPDDATRSWTRQAMRATRHFLDAHGWAVLAQFDGIHRYHLDDDPELASSLTIVERVPAASTRLGPMPFAGRGVLPAEIPFFYGRSVVPPYPHYVSIDGEFEACDSSAEADDEAA